MCKTVSQSKKSKREKRDLEFDRKWSFFGGEQSCEGREKWLPRLSFSLSSTFFLLVVYPSLSLPLSFPVFLDLSKRRVAEMSLWAGLPGPPLKAALAKKRGARRRIGAKDRRVRRGPPFYRY